MATDAALDSELPLLRSSVVLPTATTLKVYEVSAVSPVKPQDTGTPGVCDEGGTAAKQVPVAFAGGSGVAVTRYESMPAPAEAGVVQLTVILSGVTL